MKDPSASLHHSMIGPGFAGFCPVQHDDLWRRLTIVVEKLFSSPALYRTLALFFEFPEEPLNPRLISRYTGTGMKSVLREIRKLEEMGIIRGWPIGQYRFYLLVQHHPVHDGLRPLFAAISGMRKLRFQDPALRMWDQEKGW
jgi:hypothetical protein